MVVFIGLLIDKFYLQREEAMELVKDAISAGIFNDLGSGSNVDLCVITKGAVDYRRGYAKPNERVSKERSYKFRPGTTSMYRKMESLL